MDKVRIAMIGCGGFQRYRVGNLLKVKDAEIVVSIRERVEFSRALLERLPKLKLIALVGRNSHMIDFPACTELGIPVATGKSNSPVAPAELTVALIVAARRNIASVPSIASTATQARSQMTTDCPTSKPASALAIDRP